MTPALHVNWGSLSRLQEDQKDMEKLWIARAVLWGNAIPANSGSQHHFANSTDLDYRLVMLESRARGRIPSRDV